jgi:lysozyme
MSLSHELQIEEGLRLTAYPDPISQGDPWTIGYGHTGSDVYKGLVWNLAQAQNALNSDIAIAAASLEKALPWTSTVDPVRRDVLVDMTFNMGINRLLQFHQTLAYIQRGEYDLAAKEMLNSAWANQTKTRATRLSQIMSSGINPFN